MPTWAPTWLHFRGPGASWGALGRSWAALGGSWGRLGGVLGHLGDLLGTSWAVLGDLGQKEGGKIGNNRHLEASWPVLGPKKQMGYALARRQHEGSADARGAV